MANHACVAAAGSNGFAVSVTPGEAAGVEVCAFAAIESPRRREKASHHEITWFMMHINKEIVPKRKASLAVRLVRDVERNRLD